MARPDGAPEFELYRFAEDPLDQQDLAEQEQEIVTRLSRALAKWRIAARAARLASDAETTQEMSAEQLEQLRSLGYL